MRPGISLALFHSSVSGPAGSLIFIDKAIGLGILKWKFGRNWFCLKVDQF